MKKILPLSALILLNSFTGSLMAEEQKSIKYKPEFSNYEDQYFSLEEHFNKGLGNVFACNDGKDNDGDGLIDMKDSGCINSSDDSEFNIPTCFDNIDNNNNGLIDYPEDPTCSHMNDSES